MSRPDYRYELHVGPDVLREMPMLRALAMRPGFGMDRVLDLVETIPETADSMRVVVAGIGVPEDFEGVGMGFLFLPEVQSSTKHDLMVHVLHEHRRRGVGTAIVHALMRDDHFVPRVWRQASYFWERFGEKVRVA